ncbi:hypothetical protein J0H58_36285, partial [bacterium]|nr:hypothetical protein [bacterium]
VVRSFPVDGVTVQEGTPGFVSVRGADGVVRTYPVAPSSTAVSGALGAAPVAAPVAAPHCR